MAKSGAVTPGSSSARSARSVLSTVLYDEEGFPLLANYEKDGTPGLKEDVVKFDVAPIDPTCSYRKAAAVANRVPKAPPKASKEVAAVRKGDVQLFKPCLSLSVDRAELCCQGHYGKRVFVFGCKAANYGTS